METTGWGPVTADQRETPYCFRFLEPPFKRVNQPSITDRDTNTHELHTVAIIEKPWSLTIIAISSAIQNLGLITLLDELPRIPNAIM